MAPVGFTGHENNLLLFALGKIMSQSDKFCISDMLHHLTICLHKIPPHYIFTLKSYQNLLNWKIRGLLLQEIRFKAIFQAKWFRFFMNYETGCYSYFY